MSNNNTRKVKVNFRCSPFCFMCCTLISQTSRDEKVMLTGTPIMSLNKFVAYSDEI